MFDLTGKRALVTGSTQGIGYAIAACLEKHGAEVYIHGYSSYEKCRSAAESIGSLAHPVVQDLSDHACAQELYRQTGNVDILVLNASVQYSSPWQKITEEEFDRQIDTNLRASFLLIRQYAPHMIAQKWGRILTIGSVQQYKPHREMAIYAATKCAQMSLVENFASQFASRGVTVNNLSPGVIATPRSASALADEAYRPIVLSRIPLGYAGEPSDCAAAALLLCSEESRYITGIDLPVDGGMHL